ncbi:hypothetical protein OG215_38105 (plasmid) [Streptomyces globisporus]|uniref:hypothetical protein n=1 Tax=Streptomyces globisporus TaxID=1908 RepID=UPI003870B89E|nr:hypothetical protein OG215_38105 [Streptomyces globisporus]
MDQVMLRYGRHREFTDEDLQREFKVSPKESASFIHEFEKGGLIRKAVGPRLVEDQAGKCRVMDQTGRYHLTNKGVSHSPGRLKNGPLGNMVDTPVNASLLESVYLPRTIVFNFDKNDPAESKYSHHLGASARTQYHEIPLIEEIWQRWVNDAYSRAERGTLEVPTGRTGSSVGEKIHARSYVETSPELKEALAGPGKNPLALTSFPAEISGLIKDELLYADLPAKLSAMQQDIARTIPIFPAESKFDKAATLDEEVAMLAKALLAGGNVNLSVPPPEMIEPLDLTARREKFLLSHLIARQLPFSNTENYISKTVNEHVLISATRRDWATAGLHDYTPSEAQKKCIEATYAHVVPLRDASPPQVSEGDLGEIRSELDKDFLRLPEDDQTAIRAWQDCHGSDPAQWAGKEWVPPLTISTAARTAGIRPHSRATPSGPAPTATAAHSSQSPGVTRGR